MPETYVVSDEVTRETLLAVLEVLREASEKLPGERKLAYADKNPALRQYRLGLVDGMDETIRAVARMIPTSIFADAP